MEELVSVTLTNTLLLNINYSSPWSGPRVRPGRESARQAVTGVERKGLALRIQAER